MPKSSRIIDAEICIFNVVSSANNASAHEPPVMVVDGLFDGVVGAQVGHSEGYLAPALIGTPKGTAVGGVVGRSMTQSDTHRMCHMFESIRIGVSTSSVDLVTDSQYAVAPTHIHGTPDGPGHECTLAAIIGGKRRNVIRSASRQWDGSWQVKQ
jgi:surface antigen